jgi:hypothetical protein
LPRLPILKEETIEIFEMFGTTLTHDKFERVIFLVCIDIVIDIKTCLLTNFESQQEIEDSGKG